MACPSIESLLREAERDAVVTALRLHPQWSLEQVLGQIASGGPLASVLGELSIGELRRLPSPALGVSYIDAVRGVLQQAGGWVGASYLRARVGGERWHLLRALGSLIAAGEAERRGRTSSTRYRACPD